MMDEGRGTMDDGRWMGACLLGGGFNAFEYKGRSL